MHVAIGPLWFAFGRRDSRNEDRIEGVDEDWEYFSDTCVGAAASADSV